MRGCLKAAMAFGLVAILAGPALAQGGRGGGGYGGGFGGGPANLIANPAVQKELKMDEAQVEKATKLSTETREKMMSLREQLQDVPQEERMAKQQELAKPINDAAMKTVAEFLKPEQLTRLHQIELQQRGVQALVDPAVAKKLSITSEQETKVKSIMTDMQSEMREIMEASRDDRQAGMQKQQALRKETLTKVMALMTDDQKKTWKDMTGEPFTVPPMQGGRGGRGGRPGGN
jgi:delta 1-pyrroline-5-carboxylate dehydrogenase